MVHLIRYRVNIGYSIPGAIPNGVASTLLFPPPSPPLRYTCAHTAAHHKMVWALWPFSPLVYGCAACAYVVMTILLRMVSHLPPHQRFFKCLLFCIQISPLSLWLSGMEFFLSADTCNPCFFALSCTSHLASYTNTAHARKRENCQS